MGFRNLEVFNKALLAKQAWRAMCNLNAFQVKILKARYFPNTSLLNVEKGSRSSWCQSSLLEGLKVLKERCCQQIEDGNLVKIWEDEWIPNLHSWSLCVKPPNFDKSTSFASKLIDPLRNCKDLSPIYQQISPLERVVIQRIYIPLIQLEDKLIWLYSKSGIYLVKLGYHFLNSQLSSSLRSSSSNANPSFTFFWSKTWDLQIAFKVKHFFFIES